MTLRMAKQMAEHAAERVVQSIAWGAVSRIGVPVILALVITGIPAHLYWASGVNAAIALAKNDIAKVADDMKVMKDASREDDKSTTQIKTDVASVKTDVAAILRSLGRLEGQVDRMNERGMR